MQYKAENVDTDKAINHIEYCRKADAQNEEIEKISVQKKKAVPASYDECVGGAIRKIAQKLDLACSDIVESEIGGDEMCSAFADRILIWLETGKKVNDLVEVSHG